MERRPITDPPFTKLFKPPFGSSREALRGGAKPKARASPGLERRRPGGGACKDVVSVHFNVEVEIHGIPEL